MTPQPPATGQFGEPSDDTLRAWLSDLADGEADTTGSQAACKAWRERADMRQTWHSFHLIGDVLRSEELARSARRDADFLAGLRDKLALEPVVMAPMPTSAREALSETGQSSADRTAAATRRRRPGWLMPAAAAAGFVAVAGVLVVTRMIGPAGDLSGPVLASGQGSPGLALATDAAAPGAALSGAAMIRDARLDAYLRAHQAVRSGGAAPGAGLRSVEAVVPAGNGQ